MMATQRRGVDDDSQRTEGERGWRNVKSQHIIYGMR